MPFLDWLKAIGLALIVYGHVAAATSVALTPPVYPKQLGVAFFVFATGVTLVNETRSRWQVVFNRAFEVWLFGMLTAVLMSVVGWLRWGDLSESNYLPLFGLHLLIKDFPANPTTWYIGTYLHLLVVWALVLQGRYPRFPLVIAVSVAGIIVRAVLVSQFGLFTAYMALTNWMDVLLFGMVVGRARTSPGRAWLPAACLVPLLWPVLFGTVEWKLTFPLMSLETRTGFASTLLVSVAITSLYLLYTWSAFTITRRLPASQIAAFFARNSVVVFILHMPVYYLLEFWLAGSPLSYAMRTVLEFLVCFAGLGVLSEVVRHVVQPASLRARVARYVDHHRRGRLAVAATGTSVTDRL